MSVKARVSYGNASTMSSSASTNSDGSSLRHSVLGYNDDRRDYRSSVASDPFHFDAVSGRMDAMTAGIVASTSTSTSSSRYSQMTEKTLPPAPGGVRADSSQDENATVMAVMLQSKNESEQEDANSMTTPIMHEYVQALHDYSAVDSGSNVCLSFTAGQLIKVFNKDASGWWDGEVDDIRGWFPSNYVTTQCDTPRCPSTSEAMDEHEVKPALAQSSASNCTDEAGARTLVLGGTSSRRSSVNSAYRAPSDNGIFTAAVNSSRTSFTSTAPSIAATSTSERMQRAASSPVPTPAGNHGHGEYSNNHQRSSLAHMMLTSVEQGYNCSVQALGDLSSPVVQAVALMQAALDARRVSHYQPATTCLIATVRSLLAATNCLAKESPVLRKNHILAQERRQILSFLAALVSQAKTASSSELSDHSQQTAASTMIQMATRIQQNVEHFLTIAQQCGVKLVDSPTSSDSVHVAGGQGLSQLLRLENISTPDLDTCLSFPTVETGRKDSGGLKRSNTPARGVHKARSLSDIRARRKASEASSTSSASGEGGHHNGLSHKSSGIPHHLQFTFLEKEPASHHMPRSQIVQAAMVRRPSIPAVYTPAQSDPAWQQNESICSDRSSIVSSAGPLTPADGADQPQVAVEVYRTISAIHDHLISTIAAFIGHVHAHSRESHSSSYAHLIEIMQEILERVRETILIADAVSRHPDLQNQHRELRTLSKQRDALYFATTALVTSAKKVTSNPARKAAGSAAGSGNDDSNDRHRDEDDEKDELLKCATALLRSSADCVTSTRPLLLKKGFDQLTYMISPSRTVSDSNKPVQSERARTCSNNSTWSEAPSESQHAGIKGVEQPDAGLGHGHIQTSAPQGGSHKDDNAAAKVLVWQQRQTDSLADEAKCDASNTRRPRASLIVEQRDDRSDPCQSVISDRRGVAPPPNLHIKPQLSLLNTRPASSSGVSATSTVTSLNDKATSPSVPTGDKMAESDVPARSATPSLTVSISSSKAGGEAMSRDESSRGSAVSTATSSNRTYLSEASTAETSPRSSIIIPSPIDEKQDWHAHDALRRPSIFNRTRSGSTPDRLVALRMTDGHSQPLVSSPLSPKPGLAEGPAGRFERDYQPRECAYNADGNLIGGTFSCLVERMTLHDQTIDPTFANTFFMTFRMFTTPPELAQALYNRFLITAPHQLPEPEARQWVVQKLTPVRLRVYNTFKTWLESHWHPDTDSCVLESLLVFTRQSMVPAMPAAAQRLVDLVQKRLVLSPAPHRGGSRGLMRMVSAEKLRSGKPISDAVPLGSATLPGPMSSLPPASIVSKSLMTALRSPMCIVGSILDFDPLELARQLTIMENRLFCGIELDELLTLDSGKKGINRASKIKAMSAVSTRLTGWVADHILSEQDAKKRTGLVKYFIKVNERLMALQNFNTLMAIVAALGSSTIARLKKTWDGLNNKYTALWQAQQKFVEHSRNYAQYRSAVRTAVAPCLPFLGLYLTDITFCRDGNPQHRLSPLDSSLRLINFDRYQKIAKIVGDLQRFQQPYNLLEIPEMQSYLHLCLSNIANDGDHHDLYRRSLVGSVPRYPRNVLICITAD